MTEYKEEDYLRLSGIQHFLFCRRQWALIHIEQLWNENSLTLEGHYMHENVHDESFTEKRGSVLLSRAMPIRSEKLRIRGECDMVELHSSPDGISIHGRDGLWTVYPVEYKHGEPKQDGSDELQLCAQAMCLEEMLVTRIEEGALYYGKTRRRLAVPLTDDLRKQTEEAIEEMHRLYERGSTPKAKYRNVCKSCSMYELCNPILFKKEAVSDYIRRTLEEDGG